MSLRLERRCHTRALCAWLCLLVFPASVRAQAVSPADLYGELFARVQLARIFPDSKTFADAIALRPPAQIMAEYQRESTQPGFDLRAFVFERFVPEPPATAPMLHVSPGTSLRAFIDRTWTALERSPSPHTARSSSLRLPERYVVPGGRFREIYYWDSYFTMLGLEQSRRHDLTLAMLANFTWLIEHYGFVPNGTRTYYLSRSQPPFFAQMVELAAERDGAAVYTRHRAALEREYGFWMQGAEQLARGSAHRHVVRLSDGAVLNRYWDERDTPRDEAYREDIETARASGRPAAEVYRNLRAAAESGWDFSSRWFAKGENLASIHTLDIIPVDLNSLLYALELTIAKACSVGGDRARSRELRARANARREAMSRYLWSAELGTFVDYDWRAQKLSTEVTAAALYPLLTKLASPEQAHAVAISARARLLQAHGLGTTQVQTGQQWDAPNGWAPLQWIAWKGLQNYGEGRLAEQIARRWASTNAQVFRDTGRLYEKYDLSAQAGGRGGEYPVQDGFGWTNGVLRKLLALYPDLAR